METLLPQLIEQYGLVAALIALSIINYVLMRRRTQKTDDQARAAITAQQNAITAQFTEVSADNRRLHSEVQKLSAELATVRADLHKANEERDDLAQELAATKRMAEAAEAAHKASAERAAVLEKEVNELRGKVLTLETERTVRTDELKRETERASKLEREVHDLRARVARLEGENSALHQVLEKLNVVSVKPPPDDPPTEPKTAIPFGTEKEERAA